MTVNARPYVRNAESVWCSRFRNYLQPSVAWLYLLDRQRYLNSSKLYLFGRIFSFMRLICVSVLGLIARLNSKLVENVDAANDKRHDKEEGKYKNNGLFYT